jgi:glucose/arabinose dehydrogenase
VIRAGTALAALASCCLAAAATAGGEHTKGAFHVGVDEIADGLNQPIYTAFAPSVPGLAYVVERPGIVRAVDLGDGTSVRFLRMRGRVSTNGEGGLLSIAFHPNYQSNGLFYAYYTTNGSHTIRIDEFETNSDTDAAENTRRKVIAIPHPGEENHQGGTIAFGPDDGLLYAGTGDGGGGGDPKENAQDRGSLLGKLLRINPSGRRSGDYSTPPSNPFDGRKGRDEIYATGLRNPFRFSFDPPTGRIAIGDVGQFRFEEIDIENEKSLRGANFGWDYFEGFHRHDTPGDNEAPRPNRKAYQRPVHEYPHSQGNVVTGGVVVRDPALTELERRYVYADFGTNKLRSFRVKLSGSRNDRPLALSIADPTSFASGPDGGVYVTSLTQGRLLQLVPD